ncbi:MAG TPA: hypothetical protein VI112_05360 [Bacteroidia bacterium]|jgi:Tfp pilus assembly protein PilV
MALKKGRIKASLIIESLVAMVVISISFVFGCMIYVNVMNSDLLQQKQEAHLLANEIMDQITRERSFTDETMQVNDFSIEKKVVKDEPAPGLNTLRLRIYNAQKRLVEEQEKYFANE